MISIIKLTTALFGMVFSGLSWPNEFIYYPANSANDPQRKIIYEIGTFEVSDINNETGLWSRGYAPLIPGEPLGNLGFTSLAGIIHLSDLQSQSMCATTHSWNWIAGDDFFTQDAEATVVVPFTLNEDTSFKIIYTGYWNFINNIFGDVLFAPQVFQIREGLTGNGNQVIFYSGNAIEYVTLVAGDYRLSTGINNNLTCGFPSCDKQVAGKFEFTMEIIDANMSEGSSELKPFLPDLTTLNEDIDLQYIDTNGAMIYQANNQTTAFSQKPSGWFELTMQSNNTITPTNGSVIESIEIPSNRPGTFYIKVDDVPLGKYTASETMVFEDYADELDSLLIAGSGNNLGVASVNIAYRRAAVEAAIGGCGYSDRLAVKLNFDQSLTDFDSLAVYIPDPIFTSLFE